MSSVIKVLLVTGSYPPMRCGVGDYAERLACALREQPGIEPEVLTTRLPAPPPMDPPWVRRAMPSWRISALPQFLDIAREFRPDVVHMQYPTQGYCVATGPILIPMLARWRLGASVVETWHEYPPQGFTKSAVAMWMIATSAEAVVYVRPDYPRSVSGTLAWMLADKPFRFIPNASVIPAVELSSGERTALREALRCGERRIVAYFGFAYPHKGVDLLFQVADPDQHHLLLIGELLPSDAYHDRLRALAESERWRGKVTITGFVEPERAARLLAVADAAVFPFVNGGGVWNSSLHAAMSQGTFVVVTSRERRGYAADQNIFYAAPGAVDELRAALARYAGNRAAATTLRPDDPWIEIARAHVELYRFLMSRRAAERLRP